MNPLSPEGVIFDYGGTLDTNGRHWAYVLWDAYRNVGVPVTEAAFREAYVYGERTLAKQPLILPEDTFLVLLRKKVTIEFRYLLENHHLSLPADEADKMALRVANECYQYVLRVLQASRQVLNQLAARYPLALVTNFYGNIHSVLRDFNLDPFFPRVVESAVVGVRKPQPEIFRLGVDSLGLPPEKVCVVGDSFDKDIQPAHHLGCLTVWFKGQEWQPAQHDETLPDAIITDILQLPRFL